MARRLILLVMLALCTRLLIGCNTVRGMKNDITSIGEKVSELFSEPDANAPAGSEVSE